jgi:hypothetical protein
MEGLRQTANKDCSEKKPSDYAREILARATRPSSELPGLPRVIRISDHFQLSEGHYVPLPDARI